MNITERMIKDIVKYSYIKNEDSFKNRLLSVPTNFKEYF